MYWGKRAGERLEGNTPSDEPFFFFSFTLERRKSLLLLEHKDKHQKIQAHQHKRVESKRIEGLSFCVEDDLMYENGAGVYDCDSREADGT